MDGISLKILAAGSHCRPYLVIPAADLLFQLSFVGTDEYEQEVKNIIETVQSRLVVSLQTGGEVSLETAQLIAEMAKSGISTICQ